MLLYRCRVTHTAPKSLCHIHVKCGPVIVLQTFTQARARLAVDTHQCAEYLLFDDSISDSGSVYYEICSFYFLPLWKRAANGLPSVGEPGELSALTFLLLPSSGFPPSPESSCSFFAPPSSFLSLLFPPSSWSLPLHLGLYTEWASLASPHP